MNVDLDTMTNRGQCILTKTAFITITNNIKTSFSGPQPSRVGVYLDHAAGILSFYNISETTTLLHRVHTTFSQPLYAGLNPYFAGVTAEFCKLT